MRFIKCGFCAFLCGIVIASGCASEAEIKAQMRHYKNSEFGFEIIFPENWQNYRVYSSNEYIAADMKVRVCHVCLPTRSRDWQSVKVAAPYAVVFTVFIFTVDTWAIYTEKYAGKGAPDIVLGRSEKYIFVLKYPPGLPNDLYQYMKEISDVTSTFGVVK